MSKASSGLFTGTAGDAASLGEDFYNRYMPDGSKMLDVKGLPGSGGMKIPNRLSDRQMMYLTDTYGVEFAQVYVLGPGKGGGGGQYYLYSGDKSSVAVPVRSNTMLINHTHPSGTAHPSRKDKRLMALYRQAGSPQRTSAIVPSGKVSVRFTLKGLKDEY